jgi:hypothetical protein
MPIEPSGCGCALISSLSNAEACTCGCECCTDKPASQQDELAQLETLRRAIDIRMAALRSPSILHDVAENPVHAGIGGMEASAGDRIIIKGHRLGEHERDGEILEVCGPDGHPPYRVQWEDTGRVSLFFPGADAAVEHFEHTPA